jgi:hypothetical protein
MKFYCIILDDKQQQSLSYTYLKQACEQRGLTFVPLMAATFDYSQNLSQFIETPSIVYRVATGMRATILESLLVHEGVATMYDSGNPSLLFIRGGWGPTLRQQAADLPNIPTIFNITRDQEQYFDKYAEKLGGYPLILKASGGSHGSSVLRVDSAESLRSVVGYVAGDPKASFALRQYIHNATHLRMVVVGHEVVDAIRYLPQEGDFRTNAVAVPQVEAYTRGDENGHLFDLAVQAVQVEGLEFGGVDLLLDESGKAYIAEINFPCNFSRNQMNTGTDVAGKIVDYLLAKAKQA